MSLRKGQRKGNNGNHGKKGKSGRKPSAYTQLQRRVIETSIDEAEKSFDFYVQVRDNPDEPTAMRKLCADAILNRVIGMPKQSIDLRNLSDAEILKRTQDIVSTIGAILSGAYPAQLSAGIDVSVTEPSRSETTAAAANTQ